MSIHWQCMLMYDPTISVLMYDIGFHFVCYADVWSNESLEYNVCSVRNDASIFQIFVRHYTIKKRQSKAMSFFSLFLVNRAHWFRIVVKKKNK